MSARQARELGSATSPSRHEVRSQTRGCAKHTRVGGGSVQGTGSSAGGAVLYPPYDVSRS